MINSPPLGSGGYATAVRDGQIRAFGAVVPYVRAGNGSTETDQSTAVALTSH